MLGLAWGISCPSYAADHLLCDGGCRGAGGLQLHWRSSAVRPGEGPGRRVLAQDGLDRAWNQAQSQWQEASKAAGCEPCCQPGAVTSSESPPAFPHLRPRQPCCARLQPSAPGCLAAGPVARCAHWDWHRHQLRSSHLCLPGDLSGDPAGPDCRRTGPAGRCC